MEATLPDGYVLHAGNYAKTDNNFESKFILQLKSPARVKKIFILPATKLLSEMNMTGCTAPASFMLRVKGRTEDNEWLMMGVLAYDASAEMTLNVIEDKQEVVELEFAGDFISMTYVVLGSQRDLDYSRKRRIHDEQSQERKRSGRASSGRESEELIRSRIESLVTAPLSVDPRFFYTPNFKLKPLLFDPQNSDQYKYANCSVSLIEIKNSLIHMMEQRLAKGLEDDAEYEKALKMHIEKIHARVANIERIERAKSQTPTFEEITEFFYWLIVILELRSLDLAEKQAAVGLKVALRKSLLKIIASLLDEDGTDILKNLFVMTDLVGTVSKQVTGVGNCLAVKKEAAEALEKMLIHPVVMKQFIKSMCYQEMCKKTSEHILDLESTDNEEALLSWRILSPHITNIQRMVSLYTDMERLRKSVILIAKSTDNKKCTTSSLRLCRYVNTAFERIIENLRAFKHASSGGKKLNLHRLMATCDFLSSLEGVVTISSLVIAIGNEVDVEVGRMLKSALVVLDNLSDDYIEVFFFQPEKSCMLLSMLRRMHNASKDSYFERGNFVAGLTNKLRAYQMFDIVRYLTQLATTEGFAISDSANPARVLILEVLLELFKWTFNPLMLDALIPLMANAGVISTFDEILMSQWRSNYATLNELESWEKNALTLMASKFLFRVLKHVPDAKCLLQYSRLLPKPDEVISRTDLKELCRMYSAFQVFEKDLKENIIDIPDNIFSKIIRTQIAEMKNASKSTDIKRLKDLYMRSRLLKYLCFSEQFGDEDEKVTFDVAATLCGFRIMVELDGIEVICESAKSKSAMIKSGDVNDMFDIEALGLGMEADLQVLHTVLNLQKMQTSKTVWLNNEVLLTAIDCNTAVTFLGLPNSAGFAWRRVEMVCEEIVKAFLTRSPKAILKDEKLNIPCENYFKFMLEQLDVSTLHAQGLTRNLYFSLKDIKDGIYVCPVSAEEKDRRIIVLEQMILEQNEVIKRYMKKTVATAAIFWRDPTHPLASMRLLAAVIMCSGKNCVQLIPVLMQVLQEECVTNTDESFDVKSALSAANYIIQNSGYEVMRSFVKAMITSFDEDSMDFKKCSVYFEQLQYPLQKQREAALNELTKEKKFSSLKDVLPYTGMVNN